MTYQSLITQEVTFIYVWPTDTLTLLRGEKISRNFQKLPLMPEIQPKNIPKNKAKRFITTQLKG